ncbi:hypothetical protein ABC382_00585 [Lysinibacillus sp. 1P01SD]|uniref:hypothetical protein n=1 Tax=Lysinibacillus sp. 1P01SD TaxID=3132285 RepID=UPI0039A0E6B6
MNEYHVKQKQTIIESYHLLSKDILNKMNTLSPFDAFDILSTVENECLKEILQSIIDLQIAYCFMNFIDMYDDSPTFSFDDLLLNEFKEAQRKRKIPSSINCDYLNCVLNACKDVLNNVGTISACAEHHLSIYKQGTGDGFSESDIEKLKIYIRETINPNKQVLVELNIFELRNKLAYYDIFGMVQEFDYFTIGKHLYFKKWFEEKIKNKNLKEELNLLPPSKSKLEYISLAEQHIENTDKDIYTLPF